MNLKKVLPFILLAILIAVTFFLTGKDKEDLQQPLPQLSEDSRIVSLSPSITRQLISLGKEDLLCGVTSFHPPLSRKIAEVGNLINPNSEIIFSLKPDIILYSKEDTATLKIEQLKSSNIKTFAFSRNKDFNTIAQNYILLGEMTGAKTQAEKDIESISEKVSELNKNKSADKVKTAIFFSAKPLIIAGSKSYINSIIISSGGENISPANTRNPYPLISSEYLLSSDCELIICTMKDSQKDLIEIYTNANMKSPQIEIISPDNICFYTPRDYLKSIELLTELIGKSQIGK